MSIDTLTKTQDFYQLQVRTKKGKKRTVYLTHDMHYALLGEKFDTEKKSNTQTILRLPFFKKPHITVLDTLSFDNFHLVKIRTRDKKIFSLYLTDSMQETIAGNAYSTQHIKRIQLKDMHVYDSKAALSVGTGERSYYMFTDPECPFCQDVESELQFVGSKTKIHLFLFPLVNKHDEAKQMSQYILSLPKKKRFKALEAIIYDDKSYKTTQLSLAQLEQADSILSLHAKIAKSMRVTGTPTLYDHNGNFIKWSTVKKRHNIIVKYRD
jgi:thiol:disulfide interchange protein DsbC